MIIVDEALRRIAKNSPDQDDTGGCTVFTEQGASASHMTAATVLDTISRLPGMSGEANDAVSASFASPQDEKCLQTAYASRDGMPNSLDQAPSKPSCETLV